MVHIVCYLYVCEPLPFSIPTLPLIDGYTENGALCYYSSLGHVPNGFYSSNEHQKPKIVVIAFYDNLLTCKINKCV